MEYVKFLIENYLWVLIVILILVISFIGFLVDSSNKKVKKEKEKKENELKNESNPFANTNIVSTEPLVQPQNVNNFENSNNVSNDINVNNNMNQNTSGFEFGKFSNNLNDTVNLNDLNKNVDTLNNMSNTESMNLVNNMPQNDISETLKIPRIVNEEEIKVQNNSSWDRVTKVDTPISQPIEVKNEVEEPKINRVNFEPLPMEESNSSMPNNNVVNSWDNIPSSIPTSLGNEEKEEINIENKKEVIETGDTIIDDDFWKL